MTDLNIDGPRARLNRAIEHHREFDAVFDDYLARRCITVRLNVNAEGWTETIFVMREPPPLRLSLIYADMVNNLESALDLLVAQLVIASNEQVSTGNYYPIATSEPDWNVKRPDKLKGVKDEWADLIKDRMPFTNDTTPLELHPLVVLHSANKINKHTLLIPTVVSQMHWAPEFKLNRPAREGDGLESEENPYGEPGGHIEHGHVIGRARVTSPDGDLKITGLAGGGVPGNIGVGFDGFPEGVTGEQLPDLISYVMGVIQPFEEIVAAQG
jgi:hypothetical protein